MYLMIPLRAVVYAVLLGGSQLFSAAAATIATVNLSLPTSPFANRVLTRCFGSSHAATALRADWQQQLTEVAHDLDIQYVSGTSHRDRTPSVTATVHRAPNQGLSRQNNLSPEWRVLALTV